jgi:hypothetical protein
VASQSVRPCRVSPLLDEVEAEMGDDADSPFINNGEEDQ